jgi:WD40 repeat protein
MGSVNSALFSADGQRILTASSDKTARLWDGEGKLLASLEGHTGPVWNAVFSADGRRILTASDDKTARLWDGDGKPLATLEDHTGPVGGPFSPPMAGAS